MEDLKTIIRDPNWLAHRYVESKDAIQFTRVPREEHARATFITEDHLATGLPRLEFGRREVMAAAPPPAPIHFVFHSAFCCSTLLARVFDREGLALGLKEPAILNDIVGWRRRGAAGRDVAELTDHALTLLARPFASGEAVIVKPSNILSAHIRMIMALRPNARALFLYAPLPVFLTSVAKKGLDGRLWVRELIAGFRVDGLAQRLGFDDAALFGQTDLQIAAAGWLAQQALFADLLPAFAGRIGSLDSETLLDDPHRAVTALAEHYALKVGAEQISDLVAASFGRNSKTGEAYGRGAREAEYAGAAAAHRDELEKVTRWAEVVADRAGIPLALPESLI